MTHDYFSHRAMLEKVVTGTKGPFQFEFIQNRAIGYPSEKDGRPQRPYVR